MHTCTPVKFRFAHPRSFRKVPNSAVWGIAVFGPSESSQKHELLLLRYFNNSIANNKSHWFYPVVRTYIVYNASLFLTIISTKIVFSTFNARLLTILRQRKHIAPKRGAFSILGMLAATVATGLLLRKSHYQALLLFHSNLSADR